MYFKQSYLTVVVMITFINFTLPSNSWAKIDDIEIMHQLDSMQQEIRELRGLIEEQAHEIQLIKQQQGHPQTQGQKQTQDQETLTYKAAYQLIEEKRYETAMTAFQDFLWQYPSSKYVPNAHYWLGEIYLAMNLPKEKAIYEFKEVIDNFKTHHKAVDALLKIGLIEVDRKNWIAARSIFNQLIQQYPDSSRAKMAKNHLKNLPKN